MRKTLLGALLCAPLFTFSGVAAADEPIVLGDAQLDGVTAAGFVFFETFINKDVLINTVVNVDINKDVNSFVDITGNLATAEASADAIGFDTLSETESFAQVISGEFSQSFSSSVAATDTFGGTIQ
jgi:hypothetical protein